MLKIKVPTFIYTGNILLSLFISLFSTSLIINRLGVFNFSIYIFFTAFVSFYAIFDFGLSDTTFRFSSFFKNEKNKLSKFLTKVLNIYFLIMFVLLTLSIVIYPFFGFFSRNLFFSNEILFASKVFFLLNLTTLISKPFSLFDNLLKSFEYFTYIGFINSFKILLRIILLYFFMIGPNSIFILIIIDFFVSLLFTTLSIIYFQLYKFIRFDLLFKDFIMNKDEFKYSSQNFILSVVSLLKGKIFIIILATYKDELSISIYNLSLMIYTYFQQLGLIISEFYLPTLTSNNHLEYYFKSVKYTFFLLLLPLVGFSFLGRIFVTLWLGDNFSNVYTFSLILICGFFFPLIFSVSSVGLRANNALKEKTFIYFFSTIYYLISSLYLLPHFGILGIIINHSISDFVFNFLIVNIIATHKLKINFFIILKRIFTLYSIKTSIFILISSLITFNVDISNFLQLFFISISITFVYLFIFFSYNLNRKEFVT
jgi:O-antigen/teichoic acid export membrane protein